MKGKYKITIQNKKVKYEFEIRRNISVIRGDSATGKTTLVDMIREYYEIGEDSGIVLKSEKQCAVLEGRNWKMQLQAMNNSIIFIDEGNAFISSKEFASEIQDTDNYYVIVTRESLSTLPYSVEEIYGIRESGKYAGLKQTYNEFFHIYMKDDIQKNIEPQIIITEDSNSGFQFFENVCVQNNIKCISANGKSNIIQTILDQEEKALLIIADGAAFGSEMEKVMKVMNQRKNITLYVPESFEWMILRANIIKDKEIEEILNSPCDYIESRKYFSWERFFTELLIDKTKDSFLKYSKKKLEIAYMQENVMSKVLKVMSKIKLMGAEKNL